MKHGLPGPGTYVEHGSISIFNFAFARDLRRRQVAAADDVCIGGFGLLQSGEVPLGDYQNMRWRLRLNIFKGKNVLIFMNFLGGNVAANNSAKKAIGIAHKWSSPKPYHSRPRRVSDAS